MAIPARHKPASVTDIRSRLVTGHDVADGHRSESKRGWQSYLLNYLASRHIDETQRLLILGDGELPLPAVRYQVATSDWRSIATNPRPQNRKRLEQGSYHLAVSFSVVHRQLLLETVGELCNALCPGGTALLPVRFDNRDRNNEVLEEKTFLRRGSVRDVSTDNERDDPGLLTRVDLDLIRQWFSRIEVRGFTLGRHVAGLVDTDIVPPLQKLAQLDKRLRRICPPLNKLDQLVVLLCHK